MTKGENVNKSVIAGTGISYFEEGKRAGWSDMLNGVGVLGKATFSRLPGYGSGYIEGGLAYARIHGNRAGGRDR